MGFWSGKQTSPTPPAAPGVAGDEPPPGTLVPGEGDPEPAAPAAPSPSPSPSVSPAGASNGSSEGTPVIQQATHIDDPAAGRGAQWKSTWAGRWCWTGKHLSRPWNHYACFRKVVELPVKPQRALVRLSADARYTLYVNGKRVHQGPARSFPRFQSYDTLDLADVLEQGSNTICAIVHQFGVPTFFSQYRDASGFLFDGAAEWSGEELALHTPGGWVCRTSPAWRRDVARMSVQMGFQEHFDAHADPADWMAPEFEAKEEDGWLAPDQSWPVGSHPWLMLEPRGAPLLADHVEDFTQVLAQFRGENARGYKVADDVYHFPQQETRRREKALLEHPQAMLRDDDEPTVVPPPADMEFVAAVLDLGQYRTGHFMLDIAEAAGDEIIDVIYAEEIDKAQFPLIVGTMERRSGCEEATASRYRCRAGAQKWETYHYVGMRYVALIFRNVEKPLKVRRVAVRQVHAAVEDVGAFECSDERLNAVWKVGRETQRNCLFDAFVDCPWREQAQWWGDARVQARVTAYAFGDSTLLERGIRQVAQSQAPDGSLHAHPPSDKPTTRLPDFMMTWVGTLWDHYFHTGKTDLLRECLPALHRAFDFFRAHEVTDGLVGDFDGWWVFLDWAALPKGNFSGVLNLMYLQALRWAAAIGQVLHDKTADRYHQRAEALAKSCEKHFFDASAKVWRDGYDPAKGAMLDGASQHVNTLAVLLRLKPETHPALVRDVLLKSARTRRGKAVTASPFFYAYVFDALAETNHHAEVIELIKEKWGAFLDRGLTTFPENWETPAGSFCHAWSASPLYHLSQLVLGVAPVEVGWRQVRIAPKPGTLEFARGVVPSPLGPVRVEWEKVGEDQLAVRVDLPDGMEADFVGPLGESRTLTAGGHEFHT